MGETCPSNHHLPSLSSCTCSTQYLACGTNFDPSKGCSLQRWSIPVTGTAGGTCAFLVCPHKARSRFHCSDCARVSTWHLERTPGSVINTQCQTRLRLQQRHPHYLQDDHLLTVFSRRFLVERRQGTPSGSGGRPSHSECVRRRATSSLSYGAWGARLAGQGARGHAG